MKTRPKMVRKVKISLTSNAGLRNSSIHSVDKKKNPETIISKSFNLFTKSTRYERLETAPRNFLISLSKVRV